MLITVTLLLGFLVFIHEGGHYLAARACGVRVSEFMIGLPGPSIGFTRGETRFGITAVPLGGYASVCGMAPPSNSPHLKRVLGYAYRKGTVYMEDVAHDLFLTDQEAYDLLEELCDWGSLPAARTSTMCTAHQLKTGLRKDSLALFPATRSFLPRKRRNNTARCHSGSAVPSCSQVHS